jgi:hypothetical protein
MGNPRLNDDPAPSVSLSSYSSDEPLLLWTDFPADHGGGGAVVLRSLIGEDDRARVLWATPALGQDVAPNVVPLRAGSAGKTWRRSLFLDSTLWTRALAEETLRVARAHRARALWVVLHGAGVQVAAELAKRRELPMHVTVHDDPAFAVALRSRRYLAMTPWVEHELARALRGADSVDVIGSAMRERYLRRYGVDSIVVHRAVADRVLPVPAYDSQHGLRIGVIGNMYSYDQLPLLGRALSRASRLIGVPARILMVGRGFAERLKKDLTGSGVEVEAVGHVDEAEAVRLLSRCFAVYLNYPFDRRAAVLRETSFPTKLATYLRAARPIVTHAPKDTSLAPLSAMTGYVHPWTTMDSADGETLLARMWRDPTQLASAHESGEALRLRYYDPVRNRRALKTALNALVTPVASSLGAVRLAAR